MTRQAQRGAWSEQSFDTVVDPATNSSRSTSGHFTNTNVSALDQNYSAFELANKTIAIAQNAAAIAAESSRMATQATELAAQATALAEQVLQRQVSGSFQDAYTPFAQSSGPVLSLPDRPQTQIQQNSCSLDLPASWSSFTCTQPSNEQLEPSPADCSQSGMPTPLARIAPHPRPPLTAQENKKQREWHALQYYQMQLMLIEQQNRVRRGGAKIEMNADNDTGGSARPAPTRDKNHHLQDYQMQLMLLEQQNKRRLLMAGAEMKAASSAEIDKNVCAVDFWSLE